MNFAPKPSESFTAFIGTYLTRCQERVPEIEANAGKWTFEDLIPGLSDFDTRFIVSDAVTTEDWCRISMEVGRTHLELARERRDWARNLEHLPGVNLKWSELLDPDLYFTEFAKWTFYHGPRSPLGAAVEAILAHPWTEGDRVYHWKLIGTYYGPYNRTIDPPVNLGVYENKYPLHSRLMHYFAPAVHSAVCLVAQKTTPGKLDAFRRARKLFPQPELIDLVLEIVERHYEVPEFLCEPGISELDRRLDDYLQGAVDTLLSLRNGLACPRHPSPARLREAVNALQGVTPLARLFENIKFARLMKGRLWFYGQDVPWFDSLWLIGNEMNRLRANFYETPLQVFGKHVLGIDATTERILELLNGEILDHEQADAFRMFAEVTRGEYAGAQLKAKALAVADRFDPVLHALETLLQRARAASL